MIKDHVPALSALFSLVALAVLPPPITAQQREAAATKWEAKTREQNQTEWQSVRHITNFLTGRVRSVTNSYVELATGLNFADSHGRFQPADPAFRITERGAESTAGGHTVLLAPDIGTVGSVTVRQQMHEPDLTDSTLTFGTLRMPQGKAFTIGEQPGQESARVKTVNVAKRFEIIDGRKILIEAVPLQGVQAMLD